MSYVPPAEILERYADLLVNHALGSDGIAAGDVVCLHMSVPAKPLYAACSRAVWRAGGHVIGDLRLSDDAEYNLTADFLEIASDAQLDFFPAAYERGLVDTVDHGLYIRAVADPRALAGVDPARRLRLSQAFDPARRWEDEKEQAGRFTWTLASYGTEGMAAEAEMSVQAYWEQIIAACFLDDPDPKQRWREVEREQRERLAQLNALPIDRLHVTGPDADLWVTIGERRRWLGGEGRNIPSFELFTSPDWRGTEGWIRFDAPLYRFGSLVRGIRLEFHQGRVVQASAEENEPLLHALIETPGSDRIGEFSLTDGRLSRITRFMADTLFDENRGGRYGNTHLALGFAIRPCFAGNATAVSEDGWAAMGFNDSTVHTDIVSTTDRTVTATLRDGSERVIYADGRFVD